MSDSLEDELANALNNNDANNQDGNHDDDVDPNDGYHDKDTGNQDDYFDDEQEKDDNPNQDSKPVTIGELKDLFSSLVQTVNSVSNANMSRAINNNPIDLDKEKNESEKIEQEINEMLNKSGIELEKEEMDDSIYKPVSRIAKNVTADLLKQVFPLLKNFIGATLKSNIDPKINAIGEDLTHNRVFILKDSIDREFPDYNKYCRSDKFNNYLGEVIPEAGITRYDAFSNALAINDRKTIFNILKGYENKYVNKGKPPLSTNKINGNFNRGANKKLNKDTLDYFYDLQDKLEKEEITADEYRVKLGKLYSY